MKKVLVVLLIGILGLFGCATPRQQVKLTGVISGVAIGATGAFAGRDEGGGEFDSWTRAAMIAGGFAIGYVLSDWAGEYMEPVPDEPDLVFPPFIKVDPTQGKIVNNTPWTIKAYIDNVQKGIFEIEPGKTYQAVLDIGEHGIFGEAFIETNLGPRKVGEFERTFEISAKATKGWKITLTRGSIN